MKRTSSYTIALFILFFAAYPLLADSSPFRLDLQEFPLYVKNGFDRASVASPDFSSGGWVKLERVRRALVKNLPLPNKPARAFLSPFGRRPGEWTYAVPFKVDALPAEDDLPLAVYFAGLGDNWEIYLNGKFVQEEMHLDRSGGMVSHRHKRRLAVPIAGLNAGANILVVRIAGDPLDETTGFTYSSPYYIAPLEKIKADHNETITLIISGGFLVLGVYHFFQFLARRKQHYSLYCSLFSVVMGFYYITRTAQIYSFIPDTLAVVRMEFFSIFLAIPALGAFCDSLCKGKVSIPIKAISVFYGALAVLQLFLPHTFGSDALSVWQFTGIASLLWIIFGILKSFIGEIKKQKTETGKMQFAHCLVATTPGNLILGGGIFILGAIADIVDSSLFHFQLDLTRWTFIAVDLGTTLMLARIHSETVSASQAKSAFLANTSHEIATPMNAVIGLADLILRENPGEAIARQAGLIKNSALDMLAILGDILDISKVEAGKLSVKPRRYSLNATLAACVSVAELHLEGKPVAFKTEFETADTDAFIGDEIRIRQILLNLLSNAAKFTEKGEVVFGCRVEALSADRAHYEKAKIVFTVRDTGRGIAKEELPALFTDFRRLGDELTSGTGLGLAISKRLANLMGGDIAVESAVGLGSLFTFTLEQEITDAAQVEIARKLKSPVASINSENEIDEAKPGKTRIVIAEDQAVFRDMLAAFINSQSDMRVVGMTSRSAEAPALCSRFGADLALLDVVTDAQSGASNGIAAAAEIRKLMPDVKIVIMTAMPEITFVEKARAAGAHSFMYKSADSDYLLFVLRNTMKGQGVYPGTHGVPKLPLSEEEAAVVRMVANGETYAAIASRLGVSERSLNRKITGILDKSGFDSISALALWAVSQGLIAPTVG